jgi:hypothetical protein
VENNASAAHTNSPNALGDIFQAFNASIHETKKDLQVQWPTQSLTPSPTIPPSTTASPRNVTIPEESLISSSEDGFTLAVQPTSILEAPSDQSHQPTPTTTVFTYRAQLTFGIAKCSEVNVAEFSWLGSKKV